MDIKPLEMTMEDLKGAIAEGFKENVGDTIEKLQGEISALKANKVSPLLERAEKSAEFIKGLISGELKTIGTGAGSFGYTVPTTLADAIHEKKDKLAKIRARAFVFAMEGNFQLPKEGTGVTSYWVTTEDDADITESNPTATKSDLVDNYLVARVRIPLKLLNSSAVNIENFVSRLSARSLVSTEETAFVGGDGSGKPTGFRQASVGTVDQVGSDFAYNDLVNLFYELPEQYRANCVFLTSTNGVKLIRKLKDTNNMPIFNPADNTIFGKPLLECTDIPSNLGTTANETEVWVGDLQEYWIKDGLNMIGEARAVPGRLQTDVYMYEAVDGVVVNTDAFKKCTDVK